MESTVNSQERNEFFQRLKPCCVKISQLAIREADAPASSRELGEQTRLLLEILDEQIKRNPLLLDEKFSEYVFFPLHHVFRQMDQYPMPLIENCIKTLTILITHGWKAKISAELVRQILSLLTFIIDGTPGSSPTRPVAEETVLEAFRGLTALFNTAGLSTKAASGLSETESIPALGHGVTVMLNGVVDGATPQIQQEALRALQAVYRTVKELAALASFLPGTISSLAKVSSSPSHYKTAVLAKCLETVALVLTSVMADLRTRSILAKTESENEDEPHDNKILSAAWLKASAMQVKKALVAMMKLRSHDSAEVRNALNQLCVILLDECHKTLSNCATILVETAMVLGETGSKVSLTQTSLRDLISIYPELGEIVKTTTYNWMSSLSRLMQSADEDAKIDAIRNVLKALELLKELHIQSSTLDESMSMMLRDSVIALMQASKAIETNANIDIRLIAGGEASSGYEDTQYQPVLLPAESQKKLRNELSSLIAFLGTTSQQARFAGNMLEQVQDSDSHVSQVATFWLCFQTVKASHKSSAEEEMFLNLSSVSDSSLDIDAVFNELYTTAVQILDQHTDTEPADWRLEALALEATAYTAQRSGESFRPELIDVLFPVATFLGSKNPQLQKHAIVTLNTLAASCGYTNVSELIIQNVDYMVNSVSLRLNSLDISPASINVLTMMIRLAGPRLVPYLDDVVDSIFGALDNYHGYPLFVENLFVVLKEVVNQGVLSDMLLLEHQMNSRPDHRKQHKKAPGLSDLMNTLEMRKQRAELEKSEVDSVKGHPNTPWKDDKNEGDGEGEKVEPPPEPEKPPNSQTYQLLLRVANLTQHYLTSPTPTLRRSLLELLTIVSTALAPDEEAFLPLVNSIWPVMIDRLHDPEAYIVVEACHALAGLCAAAGDFLSSRFKTDWVDWLRDWCRKIKHQASASPRWTRPHGEADIVRGRESDDSRVLIPLRDGESLSGKSLTRMATSSSGSLGKFASPVRLWEGTVELLTALVSYVQIDEEMFDDILDLLAEVLERNVQVREALEAINKDAVWLSRYERGNVEWLPTPKMNGVQFATMAMSQERASSN
ncbi:armadillo-type protein [Fusarium flagelliforme]|nr:armadillo-type protein [Fusarium flagelliforme]KAH7182702.1 armadillo-type protein [Fusarium flagelliforme]